MEHEDEEFEKLLGEIPQAMAIPAHLESATTATIVADEPPSQSVGKELSPLPSTGVFDDLFQFFEEVGELKRCEEQHSSPIIYPALFAGNVNTDVLTSPIGLEQSQRNQLFKHEKEPLASLGIAENRSNLVTLQLSDTSLAAAFVDMELQTNSSSYHKINSSKEMGHDGLMIGDGTSESTGEPIALHKPLGVSIGIPVSLKGATVDMSSTLPAHFSTFPPTPCDSSYSMSAHLSPNSDGPSVVELSRQDVSKGTSFSKGRSLNFNNGKVATYAELDDLILDAPSSGMLPPAYANFKGLKHRSSSHSNGVGPNNHTHFSALSMGIGLDLDHGMGGFHSHGAEAMTMQTLPVTFRDLHLYPGEVEATTNFALNGEQGLHRNSVVASYLQAQQVRKMQLVWQRREEERQERMQQMLVHQSQSLRCMQSHVGATHNAALPSLYAGRDQVYHPQAGPTMGPAADWRLHVWQQSSAMRCSSEELTTLSENHCTFFTQGICSRGDSCPILHSQPRGAVRNKAFQPSSVPFGKVLHGTTTLAHHDEKQPSFPVRILSRKSSGAVSASLSPSTGWANKSAVSNVHVNGQAQAQSHQSDLLHSAPLELQDLRNPTMDPLKFDLHRPLDAVQSQLKYSSLTEIEGRIFFVAKDQHGCRFLQRKFDEGAIEDVQKIFSEIINHAVELMIDPFGNYLIQKLLEVCSEDQRLDILRSVTSKGELINVSLNMHGTRAVQKLIETLKSSQQVSMVTTSLRSGVVTLIKDLNGNHVIQRCLQHLSNDDNQFIFEAAACNCVEIATHRHGCCVLQRCIDHSTGGPRQWLVSEIAANSLILAQDPFGNYVVQYVLQLGLSWASEEVMNRLAENYAHLSMQKFSSNVVEKCLKVAGEEWRVRIVQELMGSSLLAQLLQDPYANYVIQSALLVSKGALHTSLVEAIHPHMPSLRSSPYGKRILSRRNLKKG